MRKIYDERLGADLAVDDDNRLRGLNYVDELKEVEGQRGLDAVIAYLRESGGLLNVSANRFRDLERRVSYTRPLAEAPSYRWTDQKPAFDSTTYSFHQTVQNTPVWGAGLTVTTKQAPDRVVAVTDTSEADVQVNLPSEDLIERFRKLFATGEKIDGVRPRMVLAARAAALDDDDGNLLGQVLEPVNGRGQDGDDLDRATQAVRLIRGRFFVYRYDPDKRYDEHAHPPAIGVTRRGAGALAAGNNLQDEVPLCGTPPVLPFPPVPETIRPGDWRLVAELLIRLPIEGARMNWRLLVDVETNVVLYLRALSSGVNGLVFTHDPITSTGVATNTPNSTSAVLNSTRDDVILLGLNAPSGGVQSLQGAYAALSDNSIPSVAPPTRATGSDFDYDSRTNDFAGVNAYYHTDRFFRLVSSLGFNLASYFNGTAFPVEVDHRGKGTAADQGNIINADCIGDGDGIDYTRYALADTSNTANPIGIATDWRVVLHELAGHGILYEHVGGANFGFAHSAGDSFAMVLNDWNSAWHTGGAIDRFVLAPFVPAVVRRSDRPVPAWGWGGANDTGGYQSEQVLSTTMFRFYRAVGGDSPAIARREFAARLTAYLMLRAVGTLTPMSNPSSPLGFLNALRTADTGDWTSEGLAGGMYGKVLTWSFERQNLNGGTRPAVDVYIDDGRAGEYQHINVHWADSTIWNRRVADGVDAHQEPLLGADNYAYVKVKNRGTSTANNVVVKAYHCRPSAGVLWPNDLQPMTTAQLSTGSIAANNAEERVVGPFVWQPTLNAWGHDCMLMIVSATGDPSNVDNLSVGEVVQDWRLVPHDNNVGQRNVNPVPGGSGIKGLLAGLHKKGFWVGNPNRTRALAAVTVQLPKWLAERGWRIETVGLDPRGQVLKSGEQRLVTFEVTAGRPFAPGDVPADDARIVVTATADGAVLGGMVYVIDPDLKAPINDAADGPSKGKACIEQAERLLDCLDIPSDKVKSVRVRKIAIDVEMSGDGCCD